MTEEKTHLRVLFEESMKAPSQFSFFNQAAEDDESKLGEELEKEQELRRPTKKNELEVKLRSITEVFLQAEAEIRKRWPEPVGKKFVRSTEANDEKWQETKEKLKAESKKRLKEAVRKGMAKPPKRAKESS